MRLRVAERLQGLQSSGFWMLELNPLAITETEQTREALERKVKELFEKSVQLQEYSRSLKERSKQINRRVRILLNTKHT